MEDARAALLDHVQPAVRQLILSRIRSQRVAKGRTVVGLASRSTEVFLVVEGTAQAVLYSANGREVSIRNIGPGDLFGELSALDEQPRSASVVATTNMRLMVMSPTDFRACIESSPHAALWLCRRLGAEVRRLTERVFELSALNVRARLHCELLRMARTGAGQKLIVNPAPTHAELANRIGTHREAVTREMRTLAELNIIRNGRRSLEFLDVSGLERAVGLAIGEMGEFDGRA